MNAKNLYDEGEINEYEEEDNEIIDNDDCFDDSLLKKKIKMKIHYKEFKMK